MLWKRDRIRIRHRTRRLDEAGTALIEAALAFPILFILFFGVSELSEGFIASRRVEAAAFTAADLVSRLQTVSSADVTALKSIIDETIKPFPVVTVGLVVSSVVVDQGNPMGVTVVAWSEARGIGVSAVQVGTALSVPEGLTLVNSSAIVARVTYTFRSTLATLIVGDVLLQAEAYQQPRFVQQIARTD
jgi:Flp pilus assembly protein TadG